MIRALNDRAADSNFMDQRVGRMQLFRWSAPVLSLVLLAVTGLAPTVAHAGHEPCIEFFELENYGGSRWSFFCGEPDPAFSAWNDKVTSLKIPAGYKVTAFADTMYQGSSKQFVGSVPNVGSDFDNLMSSWELVASPSALCTIAYEDENYGGESWAFCPPSLGLPSPSHSRWNDNISSLRLPRNHKAKFCIDLGHDANGNPVGRSLCRSYFRDIPLVGPSVNDEYSYIETGPFEPDNFDMVVMSDPQYFYCNSAACQSIPGSNDAKSGQANEWHAETIKKIRDQAGFSRFAGVIVNGDLTHGSPGGDPRETQLNRYYTDYENRYQFNVWPGLGNHDYDNYVGNGNGDSNCNRGADIGAIGDCTIWMMRDLTTRISSMDVTNFDYTVTTDGSGLDFEQYLRGSFAYSWDIGGYHFVQLHNHPAYQRNQSAYLSAEITRVFVEVKKSLQWLDNDLTLSGSQNSIINLHVMLAGDRFNATKTPEDWKEFRKILGRHPNVKAIFAGHIHHWVGQAKSYDTKYGKPPMGVNTLVEDPTAPGTFKTGRQVPVFFAGSAQYNKLMWVRFRPDDMTVWTVDTRDGQAPCVESNGQQSCPGIVDTTTLAWAPPPPKPPPTPPPVQLTLERISTDAAAIGTGTIALDTVPVSTIGGIFYAPGTFVVLTATPSSRSGFVSWAGADAEEVGCGNVPECILLMDRDIHVQAVFRPKPLLYLATRGGGSVSTSPMGESCAGNGLCSLFSTGDTVDLMAAADPRSAFDHWEGDADCSDGNIVMDGNRTCTAVFSKTDYLLTVTSADGAVVSNESPGIIDCGSDCTEEFPASNGPDTLILTASADPDFTFVRWYGDADCWDEDENDGVPERISLTVGASDLACSARFVRTGTEYALTIDKLGVPGATVTATAEPAASSADIDCPLPSCSQSYPVSTIVQLKATPVRGSIFTGWDGDSDCVDGEVTMTSNTQCSARFTAKILIVDGSDDGTLRNQYISVLNSLPDTDYDEWSVRSPSSTSNPEGRAEPIASDLTSYSRMIWFTGDAYADGDLPLSAGPSPEAEEVLAGYLDGGGCLLVSSPQYLRDRGFTQFAEAYLGVSSTVDNGGQTQITGSGPLPGFNNLGPYGLQHTDAGLDPALTDSAIVRNTVSGSEVILEYGAGGEAAVTRDNGVYRTAFMSFPFLALRSGNNRIDVMGAFLDFCLQVERDDVFEENDDFGSPTGLQGSVSLTELRIMPGNEDYFRWRPVWNADTRFSIGFPRATGDLVLEVYDQSLQLVGNAQSSLDSEEVIVADVNPDQTYFVRVYGLDGASNRYALAIAEDGPVEGDLDSDGVPDDDDAFADDPLEQSDADGDGIGDNADTDDDNDGVPDSYEIQYDLDPFLATDANDDPDLDGFTNLEESEWGTDPWDENSTPPTFINETFGCDGVGECGSTTIDPIFMDGFELVTSNPN